MHSNIIISDLLIRYPKCRGVLVAWWPTDVTARAELWDGLRSIPSDGVSLAFFLCTPLAATTKR